MIIALYGAVNKYTEKKYWSEDSIAKQTVMMLDKTGLRKKGDKESSEEKYIVTNEKDDGETKNKLSVFGIGGKEESLTRIEEVRKNFEKNG